MFEDAVAVLLFPCPDSFDEAFAADVVAGFVFFFLELLFHDGLRGDAGVIDAGDPDGVESAHAVDAGEDVLEGVVDGVAEVQGAGDVGGRDDDAVGGAGGVGVGGEAVFVQPDFVDRGFYAGGVVGFGDGGGHGFVNVTG